MKSILRLKSSKADRSWKQWLELLNCYDRPPILETGFFGSIRNLIRLILRLPKWFFTTIGLITPPTEAEAIELAVLKLQNNSEPNLPLNL